HRSRSGLHGESDPGIGPGQSWRQRDRLGDGLCARLRLAERPRRIGRKRGAGAPERRFRDTWTLLPRSALADEPVIIVHLGRLAGRGKTGRTYWRPDGALSLTAG